MSEEKVLTPKELKAQADAILAAADGKKAAKAPLPARAAKQQNPLLFSRSPPSS